MTMIPDNNVCCQPPKPRPETEKKYRAAVELYATTDLSCAEICRQCNVTVSGLSGYICKYHRHLMLSRNGIECSPEKASAIRMDQRRGQKPSTHAKYKEAIAAAAVWTTSSTTFRRSPGASG